MPFILTDVEVTELEIEGAPQGPVGKTVQKRRSVNKDFDIFGDKETFKVRKRKVSIF